MEQEERYCVKIGERYLEWYSDNWFGTCAEPLYIYTRSQIDEISEKLSNHYVYRFKAIGAHGGDTIHVSVLSERKRVREGSPDILKRKNKKAFRITSDKLVTLLVE